ncbi:MAG TPA: CusA/CzcA family heavy metal efflux RND transporter, partial [Bryobacteraceae bacterium]|nr:CusA/CzcA family heavy metal efflux RND transporter [Bryobacteraceae bacterium]
VGGIVVLRSGKNAWKAITAVREKLEALKPGLPPGVEIVETYDRSALIERAVANLATRLLEEFAVVAIVCLAFLLHLRSALVAVVSLPLGVLAAFVVMRAQGVNANIMSLGGIAIAIGAMVDAAIVMIENAHKHIERGDGSRSRAQLIIDACREVGPALFFSLMIITVSFLPVFALEAQEGRLFKPLAYTKNFSMIIAAVLAVTLDPAMRLLFTHMRNFEFRPRWLARAANAVLVGKIHSEERHPISRILIALYEPVCAWSLRWKWLVIGGAAAIVILTIPIYNRLGSEFMPPLDEGSLLYMPTTLPGISVTEAQRLLQVQDRIIKSFPEVDRVLGKAGRAETSTDPAPFSMMETVILLKPKHEWRKVSTWYDSWAPQWLRPVLGRITSDHISTEQLIEEMNEALKIPGTSNAWTMPIKARVDMLTTGIRTPVGIKIYGADIQKIEELGARIEAVLPKVQGTRSVFSERTRGGYFLDFNWKRDELARYGLTIDMAQDVIMSAVGGENVTTTIEGRERYPVNVRYSRDYRSDIASLKRVLVPAMNGEMQVPLSQLADVKMVSGPAMLRDENGMLSGYVYVDVAGRDIGSYVAEAKETIRNSLQLPPGYSLVWSGQYEAMERVREKLTIVLPVTLFLVFMLLYLNTRSIAKTMIIVLAVPFSAVGAIWLLYALDYNMSVGVWVGIIALLGVDAETGVFMLLYLDLAYEEARKNGRLRSLADLQQAIMHGAVKRIRPKFMTVAVMFMGLVPIMWSTGAGSDVMRRIAAPMIGGILTSFVLELVVYPAIYEIWKWNFEVKKLLARS